MGRELYFSAYRKQAKYRTWENRYRAELRSRGLCIQCMAISVKYVRCTQCRARVQENRQRRLKAIAGPLMQPSLHRQGTVASAFFREAQIEPSESEGGPVYV